MVRRSAATDSATAASLNLWTTPRIVFDSARFRGPIRSCDDVGMDTFLTAQDIEEFRTIWREEYGEDLPPDRARSEAERLLRFVYQVRTLYSRRENSRAASNDSGVSRGTASRNATM